MMNDQNAGGDSITSRLESVPDDAEETLRNLVGLLEREATTEVDGIAFLDNDEVTVIRGSDLASLDREFVTTTARSMFAGLETTFAPDVVGPMNYTVRGYRDMLFVLIAMGENRGLFFTVEHKLENGPKVGYLVEECLRILHQ